MDNDFLKTKNLYHMDILENDQNCKKWFDIHINSKSFAKRKLERMLSDLTFLFYIAHSDLCEHFIEVLPLILRIV